MTGAFTPIAKGAPTGTAVVDSRGGKYLTFFLDDEEYGIEILRAREIIGPVRLLLDIDCVLAIHGLTEVLEG